MRGKPLDEDCRRATISSNEYGPDEDSKLCHGLYGGCSVEILDKCTECGAYVFNAAPPED